MATFSASVPLNMSWRDLTTGIVVEIVQDKRAGIPLAANAAFTVADAVADRFESEMGAPPDQVPPPRRWQSLTGYTWLSPGPLPVDGRIAGLTRLS